MTIDFPDSLVQEYIVANKEFRSDCDSPQEVWEKTRKKFKDAEGSLMAHVRNELYARGLLGG